MITRAEDASDEFYLVIGYKRVGGHAVRVDMNVLPNLSRSRPRWSICDFPEMLSLAGVGHEAMAEILKILDIDGARTWMISPCWWRRHEQKRRPEGNQKIRRGKKTHGDTSDEPVLAQSR